MNRFRPHLIAAALLGGLVALPGSAGATPACQDGATCPTDGLEATRQPGRPARIVRPLRRAVVTEARVVDPVSDAPEPDRYVSLMILGVGF